MSWFKISFRNILHRPLSTLLCVLLLAFGTGIISLLMAVSRQMEEQFTRNIAGIDMVVGAKGSPLQLILSAVYHIDAPTGNIPLQEYRKLLKNPMVQSGIPLAYGDNYEGFRIVGTEASYLDHYQARVNRGRMWKADGEIVLGAKAAALTGLGIGSEFSGSHGLQNDMEKHDHFAYKVVGILEPTGTVIDQLLLGNITSIWAVHDDHGNSGTERTGKESEAHSHGEERHEPAGNGREITAALIKFKSPMGNMMVPRIVNQNTPMQAALPAIEINRLFALTGTAVDTLRALAVLIILLSGISVFISLYQSLKERRFELALMRSMGASRLQVFSLMILEGLMISLLGYTAGLLLGKAALYVLSTLTSDAYSYSLHIPVITLNELLLLAAVLGIGFLAAFLPSLQAFRLNISKTLSDA